MQLILPETVKLTNIPPCKTDGNVYNTRYLRSSEV